MKKLAELSAIKSPLKYAYIPIILGYLLNPLDVMPDMIPVLGLVDDLLVIVWAIDAIRKNIPLQKWRDNAKVKLYEWKLKMDKMNGKYTIRKEEGGNE